MKAFFVFAILAIAANTCCSYVIEVNPMPPNRFFMLSGHNDKQPPIMKADENLDDAHMVKPIMRPVPKPISTIFKKPENTETQNESEHIQPPIEAAHEPQHTVEIPEETESDTVEIVMPKPHHTIEISKEPAHIVVTENHAEPQHGIDISMEPAHYVVQEKKEPQHFVISGIPHLPKPKYPADYQFTN